MEVIKYTNEWEFSWDKFVIEDSYNGTFLQTRIFLNYHSSNRFVDASVLIVEGEEIVAVVPACVVWDDGKKIFYSHKGSTFGGVIINKKYNDLKTTLEILDVLEEHFICKKYNQIILKITSDLFSESDCSLLQYLLYMKGYEEYLELSSYIDLKKIETPEDIITNMSKNKRRDIKIALKSQLVFRKIVEKDEVKDFYSLLEKNLRKFGAKPIHTVEEILDLRDNRMRGKLSLYGVYKGEKILSGAMVFLFNENIAHTQYLAHDLDEKKYYAMNYMYYSLILEAVQKGQKILSWGISSTNFGKMLNYNLARFKEDQGSTFAVNRTFYKSFCNE